MIFSVLLHKSLALDRFCVEGDWKPQTIGSPLVCVNGQWADADRTELEEGEDESCVDGERRSLIRGTWVLWVQCENGKFRFI